MLKIKLMAMAKLPGYLFIVIGFAGAVFFYTYKGTGIESRELWIVFSIFMIIIGGFLLIKQKIEAIRRELNEPVGTAETGEKASSTEKEF
jgi:hypothetical protein